MGVALARLDERRQRTWWRNRDNEKPSLVRRVLNLGVLGDDGRVVVDLAELGHRERHRAFELDYQVAEAGPRR